MQRASGDPTPTSRRLRRRHRVLLAGVAAFACLTVPLTGGNALATGAAPTALPLVDTPTALQLRGTAVDWWAAERASRAERVAASNVVFGDASVEVPAGGRPADHGALVPPMNVNLPFVFGIPGSPEGAAIESRYVSPVPGPVTSPFGPRFHPILHYVRNHNGVDMTAACGTPVVAMADGVVTRSANAGGYGLLVEIDHGTLDEDRVSSRSAHLSLLGVKVGQRVQKGQQIGLAGTTGLSTGCHLHFEVLVNGTYVDPLAFLTGSPYVRLETPMVPWTPGTRPVKPSHLPGLDEVPLVTDGPSATPTPTPGPSSTPTPAPDATPTPGATPGATPGTTPTPDPGPTPTATPRPEPTASPTPPSSPVPTPQPTPSSEPSPPAAPAPTMAPDPNRTSPTPAASPTSVTAPSPKPTAGPTPEA